MKNPSGKLKDFLLNRRALCVLTIIAAVFIAYAAVLLAFGNNYRMVVNFNKGLQVEQIDVTFGENYKNTTSDVLKIKNIKTYDDHVTVRLKVVGKGSESIETVVLLSRGDGDIVMRNASLDTLKVGSLNIIYNNQYRYIHIVLSVLALLMLVYCLYLFVQTLRSNRYSYDAIFYLALSLIFGLLLLVWTGSTIYSAATLHKVSSDVVFAINKNLTTAIIVATVPLMFIYAVSVSLSNIVLMKRESVRPQNALGIATGVVMAVGVAAIIALTILNDELRYTWMLFVIAALSSLYVLFEMVLASSIFCGVYASKFTPEYDKDYIIILGCRIRPDGTLYPLIRGRVDKAIEFYNRQLEKTGKQAYFVPSGGQGGDEIMPEAEAMKNYLIEQGIPEDHILPETKSATTRENMQFSKKIIDEHTGDANVAFSTTSYHVFRSGIIASEAGIKIDGMGSRTKWYFWPNAFLREVAGLFVNQPKRHLLLLLFVAAVAGFGGVLYSLFTNI